MAIFVGIIKIIAIFIKKISRKIKNKEKLKESEIMYQNAIYTAFFDLAKFTDFRWKSADVSRTQVVCRVIHIWFWIFFR